MSLFIFLFSLESLFFMGPVGYAQTSSGVQINIVRDSDKMPLDKDGKPLTPDGEILDYKIHSDLEEAMNKTRDLVQKLLIPEDKARQVDLVLIDDMSANASFYKIEEGRLVIHIHVGLFKEIESDDELAFVLGHELEHGHSELTEKHTVYANRTGEAEIDMRSLQRRVHPNGYNEHASVKFFGKMQKKYGERYGHSHVSNGSRKDAASIGITYMQREKGITIKADTPSQYQKEIVGPIQKKYFESGDASRLAKARFDQGIKKAYELQQFVFESELKKFPLNDEVVLGRWNYTQLYLEKNVKRLFGERASDPAFILELKKELLGKDLETFFRYMKAIDFEKSVKTTYDLMGVYDLFFGIDANLGDIDIKKVVRLLDDEKYWKANPKAYDAKEKLKIIQERLSILKSQFLDWNEVEKISDEYGKIWASDTKDHFELERLRQSFKRQAKPPVYDFLVAQEKLEEKMSKKASALLSELIKDFERWSEIDHLLSTNIKFNRPDPQELLRALLAEVKKKAATDPALARKMLNDKAFKNLSYRIKSQNEKLGEDLVSDILAIQMTDPDLKVEAIKLSNPERIGIRIGNDWELEDEELRGLLKDKTELALHFHQKIWQAEIEKVSLEVFKIERLRDPTSFFAKYLKSSILSEVSKATGKSIALLQADMLEEYAKAFVLQIKKELGPLHLLGMSDTDVRKLLGLLYPVNFSYPFKNLNEIEKVISLFSRAVKSNPPLLSKIYIQLDHWYDIFGKHLSESEAFLFLRLHPEILTNGMISGSASPELYAFGERFIGHMMESTTLSLDEFKILYPRIQKIENVIYGYDEAGKAKKIKLEEVMNYFLERRKREFSTLDKGALINRVLLDCVEVGFSKYDLPIDGLVTGSFKEKFDLVWGQIKKHGVDDVKFWGGENKIDFNDDIMWKFSKKANFNITDVFKNPALAREVGLDEITDLFLLIAEKARSPSVELDEIFEKWWDMAQQRPDLRQKMRPALVSKLYYDAARSKVSRFQLEEKFGLKKLSAEVKATPLSKRKQTGVRDVVKEIHDTLKSQFPEPSNVRTELVNEIEKMLVTNKEETELLHALRVTDKNWTENSKAIKFFDLPHLVVGRASPEERLKMALYLMGVEPTNPMPAIMAKRDLGIQKQAEESLDRARVNFIESSAEARAYQLMPFVDVQKGILSDQVTREKFLNVLLGKNKDRAVVVALVNAYLNSLSDSQRAVTIARIAAMRAEQGVHGAVSLGKVLELMGPLGIKAGQFLLSSGVGGPELVAELQGLLNRASPPHRQEMFSRLEKLLGNDVKIVDYLGELVGSGSVNYVVRAVITEPATGIKREVVIRILRDAVEGIVANEEEIWKKTIELLVASKDPEQIKAAKLIEEARSVAMRTLERGGQELNLALESQWFSEIKRSYESHEGLPNLLSGFKVEVIRPMTELTDKLPEEAKKAVAMYPYIDGVPLWKVEDKWPRAQLAHQILTTELRAMFDTGDDFGVFDPDTQLGNWIIDLKNKKLVRIDYSQVLKLDVTARKKIGQVIKILLTPNWADASKKEMSQLLSAVMNFEKPIAEKELISYLDRIMKDPGFPSYLSPQERILFIREKLEAFAHLDVRLKSKAQAVFASLGRLMALKEHMGSSLFSLALVHTFKINPLVYGEEVKIKGQKKAQEVAKAVTQKIEQIKEEGLQGVTEHCLKIHDLIVDGLKKLNLIR